VGGGHFVEQCAADLDRAEDIGISADVLSKLTAGSHSAFEIWFGFELELGALASPPRATFFISGLAAG
jgi:hypothetical protein